MRTVRNLAGVVFVAAVLVSSQAPVEAWEDCYWDSWCHSPGHRHYSVGCSFYNHYENDCYGMHWDRANYCQSLSGGTGASFQFSCIGDDNPYGLPPNSGGWYCEWYDPIDYC